MSVHVSSWAWKQPVPDPRAKLVLVRLADQANDDGECWPALRAVARDTGMHARSVQRWIVVLVQQGFLTVSERTTSSGARTSNMYTLPYRDDTPPTTAVTPPHDTAVVAPTTRVTPLESSIEPSEEPSAPAARQNGRSAGKQARPPNPLWDALTAVFGPATTRTSQTLRGRVCASLKAAQATPDEIVQRAKRWPQHFDSATLTETALEKHWDALGRPPLRRRPP